MVWYSTEDLEARFEIFFQIHDGCYVAAAVAIVGCRPDGDDVFVFEMILGDVSGLLLNNSQDHSLCNLH